MQKTKQPQPYRVYTQYILIGAAIGLYYGLFYRESTRELDFGMAISISIVAALFTVLVRSWKKGRKFNEIAIDFVKVLFFFLVFMVGLEMRNLVFKTGGKSLLIFFTTVLGTGLGFLASLKKISKPDKKATAKKA
jgi:drug/metabolite transporter (DMT)-like permease